jgi:hypothetical protein
MTRETTRVIAQLDNFVESLVKKLTLAVTDELEEETPKLTTWAASNWIPSVGTPIDTPAGSKTAVDIAIAVQEVGKGIVDRTYRLPQLAFITNNAKWLCPKFYC